MRNSISIGDKFGKWTVIDRTEYINNTMWLCQCECGVIKPVRAASLHEGTSKSCGCSRGKTYETHNHKYPKQFSELDGLSKHPLYHVWSNMKYRCYDPKGKYYNSGRLICDEWVNDFMNFYDWSLNNGYEEGLTIDRIDNSGNYEPSNCRWTTREVQQNNRGNNRYLEFNGKRQTMTQWARELGISYDTLNSRIRNGWSVERAILTPVRQRA